MQARKARLKFNKTEANQPTPQKSSGDYAGFVQQLNADPTIREQFIEQLTESLSQNGVDADASFFEQAFSAPAEPAAQQASTAAAVASPPLPTVSAHWWGYRIHIHADFLRWIGASGIAVGALVAMLAPILIVLGPIAAAVGIALGVFLMSQHAALLIQANNCGGIVCLEALWAAPYVFVPKCC